MAEPAMSPGVEPAEESNEVVTEPTRHLVITVHGIRTYGDWQDDLKHLLEEADPRIVVRNFTYGYFSSIAFLIPFLRWLVARRFRKFLVHEIKAVPAEARIDLVAHSFGTFLAASALPYVPRGRRIDTIIFAGSVLRPAFPWYKYQEAGTFGRLVNDCGWDDSVLLLCQFTALMMGMAGRIGFQGMVGENFKNRYFRGGHGLYFDRDHRFMRERWVPLLTSDAPAPEINERPPLTPWGGAKLFLMNNLSFIKVAAAVTVALAIILIPVDWVRKANFQKRVERFTHIAKLANAIQIPGRDPNHVRELLRLDVKGKDGEASNEKSIDQLIGTSTTPEGEDNDALVGMDDEPRWWERMLGLRDDTRDAYLARQRHAQANYQLAAGKRGHARDLSKAKLRFEDALQAYARVNERDPAHGSYALCLIDYGLLLTEIGDLGKAVDQFELVRTKVFPPDATGNRPTMPASVAIDSLCYEATALKLQEKWKPAEELLRQAKEKAADSDELLSYVCNEIAWCKIERLEVTEAQENFRQAKAACDRLIDNGQFIFKTRLYHIRHGLAMTERLLGHTDVSYGQYDQIVEELNGLMKRDLLFSPKERRDLRVRLVNSMERRADVRFFSKKSPAHFAQKPGDPEYKQKLDAAYLDLLKQVEDDYQEAIDAAPADDPTTMITLVYKKVITHFLIELASEAAQGEGPGANSLRTRATISSEDQRSATSPRSMRQSIDVEFAGAERIWKLLPPDMSKGLKIYREIATCCMKLRDRPPVPKEFQSDEQGPSPSMRSQRFDPQAVAELRDLTIDYGRRSESMTRDGVEMLLVAFEILLEPTIEPDRSKYALDASRMMGVLGTTTKVASHPELELYVARFNRIVDGKFSPRANGDAREKITDSAPLPRVPTVQPIDPSVVLYLRLTPTRSLTVTDATSPRPSRLAGPLDGSERTFRQQVMKPISDPPAEAPLAAGGP